MLLTIKSEDTVKSIQQAFSNTYPYLTIEFLIKWPGRKNQKPEKIRPDDQIKRFSPYEQTAQLTISDKMTVTEIEQIFNKIWGVGIQIFRKSGSVLVETRLTEHWTLKQQNEEGKNFSAPYGD